jgi:hypothetical protein
VRCRYRPRTPPPNRDGVRPRDLDPDPADQPGGTCPVRWRRQGLVFGLLALGVLVAGTIAVLGLAGPFAPVGTTARAPAAAPPDGAAHVGASSDGYRVWERRADGQPVRWDPCSPIDLVLAPDGVPPGARQDLEGAIDRLGDATGLELRLLGTTDERPSGARLPYQPERYGERWAPVLIAWGSPHEDGVPLRDIDRGVGIPVALSGPDTGEMVYVSGQVVLNAERDDLVPGFADRATSWGATLVHELAHVLGLDHVDDPAALLYTFPGEGPVTFSPGDLAGLRAVGAAGGCLEVPEPRPVVVEVEPSGARH